MKNTLIDAGPLIALFNKIDKYHRHISYLYLRDPKGSSYKYK